MDGLDNSQLDPAPVESCALLIIGAGIAGMNALFAASRYLGKDDKVILVDRRPRNGGMWCDTYDYVRLHQPHPMFTAGNIPWTLGAAPEYLANKPEILAHFAHCLAALRERLTLIETFEHEYLDHREVDDKGIWYAEVRIRRTDSDEPPQTIRTTRCIKALGFDVPQNPPLALSSAQVQSVSPDGDRLFGDKAVNPDKPVYVIGGGKTGMDTAHALLRTYPGRAVHMIVGRGTMFMNRDQTFPTGLKRWWGGKLLSQIFVDLGGRFDGDNEHAMTDYFRAHYALKLDDRFEQYLLGLLSEAENDFIRAGITDYGMAYLDDVVDVDGEPELVFRDGSRKAVEPGSVFVNCSGYIMRSKPAYEPYLSDHGTVVSVSPSAGIHILTTFASYFLAHLYFLGKLDRLPLYELDHTALMAANKLATPYAVMAQALYNVLLIMDDVPMSVMTECGLDFDRWFPLPRRIAAGLRLKRNKARYLAHCGRALDRIHQRFDIRCGVLESVARRNAARVSLAQSAEMGAHSI